MPTETKKQSLPEKENMYGSEHRSLCKIKAVSTSIWHLQKAGQGKCCAWCESSFLSLNRCVIVWSSSCAVYLECMFIVAVFVPDCRHECAGVEWGKQTIEQTNTKNPPDCLFCLSSILSHPPPPLLFHYSMSAVAMETILLIVSSLLVYMTGKYNPAHATHTCIHAYKHTCMHTRRLSIGRQCWCKRWHFMEKDWGWTSQIHRKTSV